MNETIFRAYDVRGVYGSEITLETAYLIGKAFGTRLRKKGDLETVIGYDNRTSSPILFNELVKGINETGINVINIGMVTTPMYYYSWTHFNVKSGIMITASHNPKEYNGFKISFNGLFNAYGEDIQAFKEEIKKGDFLNGNGFNIERNIKENYIDFITNDININQGLKVVVDAGNGAASLVIKEVLDKLKINYIPLFIDSNPDYPNHHPDPSVHENLKDLSKAVIENKADIGFAYDGDADRIGLVDELGQVIPIDHFMIIVIRNILKKLDDKRVLYDVKCGKALEDEIDKLGGTKVLSRTGNSYLRARIVSDNIKFGGELSGHVFFNDKFKGYDDGIYASLRMLEILSEEGKRTSELLEGINNYVNTPEIKIKVKEDNKFAIVEEVKTYAISKNYNYIDIDGVKIIFNDAFVLVRASNTGPDLTLRFEAKTSDRLQELQNEFMEIIKKYESINN